MVISTHYYLIKGKIFSGSLMPEKNVFILASVVMGYDSAYVSWKSSLQPCNITENELYKLTTYLEEVVHNVTDFPSISSWEKYMSNPILVTGLVELKETCIQTGLPCGMTCFSEDTCKGSLYLYFKNPKQL